MLQSFFISLRKSSIFDVTRVNSVSHNLDFCFSVEIAYLIKHMSSEIKVDKKEGILLWMVSMPQLYYKWHYTIFLLLLQVLCDGARFHFSIVQTHTFFSFFFVQLQHTHEMWTKLSVQSWNKFVLWIWKRGDLFGSLQCISIELPAGF